MPKVMTRQAQSYVILPSPNPQYLTIIHRVWVRETPSYLWSQSAVGGLITSVDGMLHRHLGVSNYGADEDIHPPVAYGNDEALLLGMPHNVFASKILQWPSTLHGPIVIHVGLTAGEVHGEADHIESVNPIVQGFAHAGTLDEMKKISIVRDLLKACRFDQA